MEPTVIESVATVQSDLPATEVQDTSSEAQRPLEGLPLPSKPPKHAQSVDSQSQGPAVVSMAQSELPGSATNGLHQSQTLPTSHIVLSATSEMAVTGKSPEQPSEGPTPLHPPDGQVIPPALEIRESSLQPDKQSETFALTAPEHATSVSTEHHSLAPIQDILNAPPAPLSPVASPEIQNIDHAATPAEFVKGSNDHMSPSADAQISPRNISPRDINAKNDTTQQHENETPVVELEQRTSVLADAQQSAGLTSPDTAKDSTQSNENLSHAPQIKVPDTEQNEASESCNAAKNSRPREEEAGSSPAAKRCKLENSEDLNIEQPSQAGEKSSPSVEQPASVPSPQAMTRSQQKHLQKAISNVKRLTPARHFVAPVDYVKLNIPQYPTVIKRPMDLKTLEESFRTGGYQSIEACVADFNLIVDNAATFNGPNHPVAIDAMKMKSSFERYMADLPGPEAETAKAKRKSLPDPVSIAPPVARRESRPNPAEVAKSPDIATSPRAFALDPDGLPLIRRESTADGRPKREIHRPPPRDLPYANQKPKKKKYQWELKFCDHVLKELAKPKYTHVSFAFAQPVDPVALNIPNYLSVVKKPMDFGTIRQKLDHGEYENAKEFDSDARQVFKNCYAFNPEGHDVNVLGHKFEAVYSEVWSRKREWLDENTPASGQRSPDGSQMQDSDINDQDMDEDEEDEEQEDDGQMEIVSKLQKQIAEMSRQVELITSANKKHKSPPSTMKKSSKIAKTARKDFKKPASQSSRTDKGQNLKPVKKDKIPYVTYEQKQDISNRINSLSEGKMTQALTIIRNNMPSLKGVQEDELELDIDELSNEVLYKLLVFVRRHAPRSGDEEAARASNSMTASAATSRKKNKQMSKTEQEARIARVQSGLSAFQKGGNSGRGVHPSIEDQGSDDDGEDDDSESEED